MNTTVDYYNKNAEEYFDSTSQVDFGETYQRFLKYVPDGGSIMDIGCGSGRDVKWFCDYGYDAYGLDASSELAAKAESALGIHVITCPAEDWIADDAFDGVWCCASLMHLNDEQLERFFSNLDTNLKDNGALYISVKTGIYTGNDSQGRYFRNFTEQDIQDLLHKHPKLTLKELWYTEDKLARNTFKWMNMIIIN